MPRMDEATANHALLRALIIGDGKCGKTDWTVRAAMAGFNLLYFDGDVARATIMNMLREGRLTKEAAARIYLLDVVDDMTGGMRGPKFYDVTKDFITSIKFRWNDDLSKLWNRKDPSGEVWEITPSKMDWRDILVLDSWTSLTESIALKAAEAHSVDLSTATTSQMRPVYQAGGIKATEVLQVIRSLKCHVVCIGHPDEYSHQIKPTGVKVGKIPEGDMIIDWTKMIPKSTSKPHAMTMSKYFTDILWMTTNKTGSERLVDARIDEGKISGGHFNERKNTEDYSFAKLVEAIGGSLPPAGNNSSHWLAVIPPAEPGSEPAPAATQVLDGTTQTTAVKAAAGGMSGLFKK